MSYINDALKKAQREREKRYGNFDGIVAMGPDGADRFWKRRILPVAALILLVATGVLITVLTLHRPNPPVRKAPQSSVAATPAPAAAEIRSAPEATGASGAVRAAAPEKDSRAGEPMPFSTAVPRPRHGGTNTEPGAADARYKEALLSQRKGDLRRAEALYRKALTLDPGHVRALNNLGVVYLAQGKSGKAVTVLIRAVVLKKDYADPYYNLACLYARKNEIDESLWYLKIAATLDGNVIHWVKKDADMQNVVASPEFKKLMEGQKN
jgi:tetratricopeptide (TPR) repeat protein